MTEVARAVSYPARNVELHQMEQGMTEEQIAAEIARQQAAKDWAALVKQCAERGDA